MRPRWERFYRKQAEEAAAFGPYAAIRTIRRVCDDEGRPGSERLEHIRFFLQELDIMISQKKEA